MSQQKFQEGATSCSAHPLPIIIASSFVRKLRGHSQAVLVEGPDQSLYVVKMRGHPKGVDHPANELIGGYLCENLGISVPQSCFVRITEQFLDLHPDAWFRASNGWIRPPAGLHYATEFIGADQGAGRPLEILSATLRNAVLNDDEISGMYLFDIWANHLDQRQRLYLREGNDQAVRVFFLDHGKLFGDLSPHHSSSGTQAFYRQKDAANTDLKAAAFSAWIARFRAVIPSVLPKVLKLIPSEWCISDLAALEQTLLRRLEILENLVVQFGPSNLKNRA